VFVWVKLLNVCPIDVICKLEAALVIVDVPALKVKLNGVVDPKFIAEVELRVIVLDPSEIDLVFELLEDKEPAVKLKFPVLKDPFVTVKIAVDMSVLKPSVHPHPTPLTVVVEARTTPFVVNVLPVADPVNVIAPV